MSKYLARRSDGAIFKQNKNGTYSMVDTGMFQPYEYDRSVLRDSHFEEITEEDFPRMLLRKYEYYSWGSWYDRSDGHDGSKGGSIEEFRQLPDYQQRVERTKRNFEEYDICMDK